MPFVRTRISVAGFSEPEVRTGLSALLDEFQHRPWIIQPDASWDSARGRLVVVLHYDGGDAESCGRAAADEVWDCVIACLSFASEGIRFEVEETAVLTAL
jgi:hypothetical protein